MVFVRCCLKYLRVTRTIKGRTLTLRVNLLTSESWGCYVQADPNLESLVQQTHLESATNSPWRRRILWFSMRFSMSGEIHAGSDAATSRSGPASPVRLPSIENSKKQLWLILKRRDIWYRNGNTWVILLSIYIINTAWLYDCIFCYMQFAGDTLMPCQKSHERDRLHALFTFWVVVTWFRLSELLHRLFRSSLYPVDASLLWSSVVSSSCWSAGKDCPLFVSPFGACPTSPPQATGHHGALFYPSLNIWHPKTTAQHGTTWKQP